MTNQLIALLDGREVGIVNYKDSRLSFTYSDTWRNDPNAYPLSLSMPLGSATHGHARIEAFLWGLLPDNDRVLQSWGKRFQVSPKNVFRLISHVGEDCAGAVQFVSPERLETLIAEPAAREIQWLTEEDVAERLRTLRADHAAWRAASDTGQFSLAGAQPKTALLFERKRWGVPSGRIPTTHILKPPTGEWDGHAENEHFSLQLARSLGLIVPNSNVVRFQEEIAIVVERYDRARAGGRWVRIHQEDMCQALGLHPTRKYESDSGPGVTRIVELLREQSSSPEEDVQSFVDAIAFNWLIAGTDAHAKNYSLLLGQNGVVRLAPLYDLASILPYPAVDTSNVKLAMKIGGEYRLRNISLRHWQKLAIELRLDEATLIDRIKAMAQAIPDQAGAIQKQIEGEGLSHVTITRLCKRLATRAVACQKILQLSGSSVRLPAE
ncbi:MAG: type II toxin-antitoxin system HipA family toxin [Acidobacteria bacterium]|nr:type II toxin-antitoxin system HipA family toxin [Acidobacteriota bacterium]MBW4044676.1 type II toxin-antitoxin system HipA family toxin [Acidobacteriota bacterium]